MNYPKELIDLLSAHVEKDAIAYNKLMSSRHPELIAVKDAVAGSDGAVKWLLGKKFMVLAAFAKAVEGDKPAFDFLMKNKAPQWAATANAIKGDRMAASWLKKNNLGHYAVLAEKLKQMLDDLEPGIAQQMFQGPY